MNKRDWCASLAGLVLLASFLFVAAPRAYGQAASAGAILGTVSDPSGGVIPDTEVTITNTATQQSRVITTNAGGFYSTEALLAGMYDIAIKKEGFKTFVSRGVKVDPGERVSVNASLELGSATTEVMVTAAAVKVETTSGESSGSITGEHIEKLMINGRNYFSLALLIPGVNSTSISGAAGVGGGRGLGGGGLTGESPISVNGLGRDQSALYTVDGAYNMAVANSINMPVVPPLDTISEFRILKDNYSAKYGGTGSAQVMVETKSGAQDFHGAVYEYMRNDALDAAPYFTSFDPVTGKKVKGALRQHNFGFTFGGPFYIPGKYNTEKKRTFFFVNQEWRRRLRPLSLRGAMIPEAMRNGDFTNSPTRPATGLVFDSTAQNVLGTLYPGVNCLPSPNQLNPACFDQNAVRIMDKFWPLPNNTAAGFLNYINPGVSTTNNRNDTYRVDQYFGERFVLMGRWMNEVSTDQPPALVWGPNPAPTTTQTIRTAGLNALLRFTATISPTMVNTFSYAIGQFWPDLRPFNVELPSDVTLNKPFSGNLSNRIPQISIDRGWAGLGVEPLPIIANDTYQTYSDDFSVIKGNHVLQGGMLLLFGTKRQDLFAASNGSYSFSGVHTGDPVADYLLGLDSNFFQTSNRRRGGFHYRQFEPYFQDDWKVNSRLTLNLGLRYYYFTPDTEEDDQFSDFDPNKWDPAQAPQVLSNGIFVLDANRNPLTATGAVADVLNGVILPGQGGVPRGIYTASKTGFAPRVGFAWDVSGDGKTSLRGGYGIGYHTIPFANYVAMNNPPFIFSTSLDNGTFTDPAFGASQPPITPSGMTVIGGGTFKPSMVQTWSLTVDRELVPNAVLSVAYVGTGGRNILTGQDLNFPLPVSAPSISDPACLASGQTVPSGGFQFDPCLNRGLVSSNFTRPFVGWGGLGGAATKAPFGYAGTSNYHSLQAGFRYRPGKNLTLNAAYTWGKVLTDVGDRGLDARNQTSGAQNPRNFRAEYGPPGWDRTHIFTASYIWDLPILRNRSDFLGKAFGGWTFSGITVIESGFAFGPGGCGMTTCGLAGRPDLIGKIEFPKTQKQWFTPTAFAPPQGGSFGFFGNAGTGLIRGPGEQTWNWALFKTFNLTERVRLQFRSEFFNVWNHPNFTTLQTDVIAGNVGELTNTLDERQIELGLRLDF